jgi:hypothetical protein
MGVARRLFKRIREVFRGAFDKLENCQYFHALTP